MAYVTTLLLTALFINSRNTRWFMSLYAFALLFVASIIKFFGLTGEDIYEIYGGMFCLMVIACGRFLGKWERLLVGLSFFLLAAYSGAVTLFWGQIPLWPYNQAIIITAFFQLTIITISEKSFSKAIMMWFVASLSLYVGEPYV